MIQSRWLVARGGGASTDIGNKTRSGCLRQARTARKTMKEQDRGTNDGAMCMTCRLDRVGRCRWKDLDAARR